MQNHDPAHIETEAILAEMEKKIAREYKLASKEAEEKLDKYMQSFAVKDKAYKKAVDAGEKTEEEYKKWRIGQIAVGKRWEAMKDTLAQEYVDADKIAKSIANGYMPEVYALNFNYGTYEAEAGANLSTGFVLYDRQTVERLLREDPDIMPPMGKKTAQDIAEGKAFKWEKKQIQSAMIQGILQGESINKIAKRLPLEVGEKAFKASVRNARTMTTGVQNAGRVDSYKRAEKMGIKLEQEWRATLDMRTRHSHRLLDGERRKVGDEFSNGLKYPADPDGKAGEVYNCRCTLKAVVEGLTSMAIKDRSKDAIGDMTYEEWKTQKKKEKKALQKDDVVTVTNKEEARAELNKLFGSISDNFWKNNEALTVENVNQLLKLNKRFNVLNSDNTGYITGSPSGKAIAWASSKYRENVNNYNLSLVNKWYKNVDNFRAEEIQAIKQFWSMPCTNENVNIYTVTHEFGHLLQSKISKAREDWKKLSEDVKLYNPALQAKEYNKAEKIQARKMFEEIVDIAKDSNPDFNLKTQLSIYGHKDHFEAFAEMFANSQCGEPNELGLAMQKWLEKEGY